LERIESVVNAEGAKEDDHDHDHDNEHHHHHHHHDEHDHAHGNSIIKAVNDFPCA
jgi:hypothetical protein